MVDFIIFKVGDDCYGVNIENIQRIIQPTSLTKIAQANNLVDGMMNYENRVIKVVNFRKVVNLKSYEDELLFTFNKLKNQHKDWVNELIKCVEDETEFKETTNARLCELGIWLDKFTSHDDKIRVILKKLNTFHKQLHLSAIEVLEVANLDKVKAIELIETKVHELYKNTIYFLNEFIDELDPITNSIQKLLFFTSEKKSFAIKVDEILDIAHVDKKTIESASEKKKISKHLNLFGVVEINGVLVNIIKDININ
ncbi:MAG: chemotaxis protein CheW [Campylobacterota bacterium]|nr:chemotaxis protein CheW [Campylobacterota bacterium]